MEPNRQEDTQQEDTLVACRKEIDAVDQALIDLLNQRARIAQRIGRIKRAANLEVFDAGRHLAKLNEIALRPSADFPSDGLRLVFSEILSACLALQASQTVAFLGPEATFSHIAAIRAFGRSVEYRPMASIHDIFEAVEKEWTHFGIVPIENSTGGVIHTTLDELMISSLSICAEIHLPIQHHLMSLGRLESIKKIYTHPQILSQCRDWLRANLPDVAQIETSSSGEGVKIALSDPTYAAIGPELSSTMHGLPILVRRIEDRKDNVTRFLLLGRKVSPPSGSDKTSIMFSIKDEPGVLKRLLTPLSDRAVNMTKIESRPSRMRAWHYIFFVDLVGHQQDASITAALEEMRGYTTSLRVLGSYPVDTQAFDH